MNLLRWFFCVWLCTICIGHNILFVPQNHIMECVYKLFWDHAMLNIFLSNLFFHEQGRRKSIIEIKLHNPCNTLQIFSQIIIALSTIFQVLHHEVRFLPHLHTTSLEFYSSQCWMWDTFAAFLFYLFTKFLLLRGTGIWYSSLL